MTATLLCNTEDAHPPAFVSFESLPASNGTASSTPMVIFSRSDSQEVVNKSDVLLQRFCPHLYPEEIKDDIIRFEQDIGERLGATIRCYAYYHFLCVSEDYHTHAADFMALNCSKVENILFHAMFNKGLSEGIIKALGITKETSESSLKSIREVFSDVSERLATNGGTYIMDTQSKKYGFTAADLTFAALASPVVFPPCLAPLGLREDGIYPPGIVELREEMKATTAGRAALEVYRRHRPVGSDEMVHIKSGKRDKYPWSIRT